MRLATLLQKGWQILLGIRENNAGREKTHALLCVFFDHLPHPFAKDGADENIRIENEPLKCRADFPLKLVHWWAAR